jgi:signal transduction histidine kinase
MWEDREGRLWFCASPNNLFCRDETDWQRFTIPLEPSLPLLRSLAEEPDGTLWAGSIRNGLYCVQDGTLTRFTTDDGLSDNAIESLLVDREGNLWVGTIGSGLNCLTRGKVRAFGPRDGLGYPVVRGLAEVAPGELWVGTHGDGMYVWKDGQFSRFEATGRFATEVFVNAMLRARDGSIWAATGHGLYRFVDGVAEILPDWLRVFENTSNATLWEDREAGLWMGASTRLWHLHGGRMTEQARFSAKRVIIALTQGPTGALWVGTEGDGLYRVAQDSVTHFTVADGLGSSQVRALHFDADGTLWIGAASGGLTRFKNGRFFTARARQGLPDDTVSQILEDDQGYLWIGGNRGIARIDKRQFEELSAGRISSLFPRVITESDGLLSEECTGNYSPAGLKLSSGELCFATLKGIVLVDPSQETPPSPAPDVWLEEVVVNDENLASSSAASTGPANRRLSLTATPDSTSKPEMLTLAPGRHRVEFHYTGLNFTAPERVRFRYQLEGLDADWVDAGSRRTAYYNYVPPGRYHFRVIACNKDGIWSPIGAAIGLEVQPFLWQRPWFSGAVILLGMGFVVGTVLLFERRRQARERNRLATEHAVERERARIARDIHDELGATLSEIQLLSRFAQGPNSPPERVREDIKQIAAKAVGSTQALDEIVWAVDPQSDSLESFINYASNFATEYLGLAEVRCRLDLPTEIPSRRLRADVRYNLFLAFKESLTNVVKHAEATEVWIRVKTAKGMLIVSITDNGKGMPVPPPESNAPLKSAEGHDGLANMRTRLATIGGRCEFHSESPKGTTVRFRIPLQTGSAHE